MRLKKYKFDFFQCTTNNSNSRSSPLTVQEIFEDLNRKKAGGISTSKDFGGVQFELRDIKKTDFGYRGVIGKHRKYDLPNVATINGSEREIELQPEENLLEKSHFHYYADYDLVILQRNRNCLGSVVFGRYLSNSGFTTVLNPIIETADLQLLMRNSVKIRTATFTIARPRNPELFSGLEHDFNNSIFQTLSSSGSAKLNLTVRGDGHSKNPESRYLDSGIKRALNELRSTFDVRKCQLLLEDEDTHVEHPIDLVADRLLFEMEMEVEGRYAPTALLWEALDAARNGKQQELESYFGSLNSARIE